MRALETLHDELRGRLELVHATRWRSLWRTVQALILARRLWLTALGRALPTSARRKHAIKAVDRLLGNERLYEQRFVIAASVASILLRRRSRPVVLVDTMEIRHRVVAVTASLAHDGRSFPIWSTTIKALVANAGQCRRFLRELRRVLPPDCRPILVTDGGFQQAWLRQVDLLGWDYVARVRGKTKIFYRGKRLSCPQLHRLATNRAKNLGKAAFPVRAPDERRLVLSKLPTSKHRRRKTRTGPDRDNNYKHYRKNAREPLLLATSLTCRPQQVVAIYQLRMQIEESFRDLKCHRWGWSLRHCRSRSRARMELLLLIASIAIVVQQTVGIAGELQGLNRSHQANTVKARRVLSIFLLGAFLLGGNDHARVTTGALQRAARLLRRKIAVLGPSSS